VKGNPTLRAELGVLPKAVVVGIVGRLQPNKGQDRFLKALASVIQQGHDVHGLVVGGDAHGLSPDYAAHLDRLIPELGLRDRVTMTGQVDDARPYFELMEVAVNASDQESFTLSLIVAQAARAVFVATGLDGRREIGVDGVTGVLIHGVEPAEIADAIGPLIEDRDRRLRLAAQARQASESRFSAQRMAEQLATRLEGVLDG
jgi:glycosyltransferase involved in cell wall biosynthesis